MRKPEGPLTSDQFYYRVQANIANYGFHITGVLHGTLTPSFNYTIGLSDILGYELFMCGIRNDHGAMIINDLVPMLKDGKYVPSCTIPKEVVTNFPLLAAVCTRELDWLYSDFTVQIERYYGERRDVVQLLMSDKQGLLPTEQGYDIEYMARFQPIFSEIG